MKKQILNIGQELNKSQLQQINGGTFCIECDPMCRAAHLPDKVAYTNCVEACLMNCD